MYIKHKGRILELSSPINIFINDFDNLNLNGHIIILKNYKSCDDAISGIFKALANGENHYEIEATP